MSRFFELFLSLRGQQLNECVENVIGRFNRGFALADRAGKLLDVRAEAAFVALLKNDRSREASRISAIE